MWRIVAGVTIGVLLFFPGIVLLQWLAVDVLGLYEKMTLTDGALVFIIILQCVIIVTQASRRVAATSRHPARMTMVSERGEPEDYLPPQRRSQTPPRPPRRGYDR